MPIAGRVFYSLPHLCGIKHIEIYAVYQLFHEKIKRFFPLVSQIIGYIFFPPTILICFAYLFNQNLLLE